MELHMDLLSLSIGTLMGAYIGWLIWSYIPPTIEERIIELELQLQYSENKIDTLKQCIVRLRNTSAILLRKLRG